MLDEDETAPLLDEIADKVVLSCGLCVVEVPRAVRRAAAGLTAGRRKALARGTAAVLGDLVIVPLEPEVLVAAGGLPDPILRSLDAIHVAAALAVAPLDGFVTYDERQAAAARLAGLRTLAPGL